MRKNRRQDGERDAAPGGGARGGLFSRLFGRQRGPRPERIEIRVAAIADQAGADRSRHVVAALGKPRGVRVRPLTRALAADAAGSPAEWLAAAAAARQWLAREGADLLIWGEIPAPGTTLHLRFVSAAVEEEDLPGGFSAATTLNLPVDFGPEFAPLLLAVSLAATTPGSEGKRLRLGQALPDALYAAMPCVHNLPADLTARERAAIHMCYGNALATLANRGGNRDLYQVAAQTYQASLENRSREDDPLDWALTRKHLGAVLQVLAERTNDADTLAAAADALRGALDVLTRAESPRAWAATQNRLGQVLYRLDSRTGEGDILRESLNAFQAALMVFTRGKTPLLWAEVMSNFAQAAQVLGQQHRNTEVLTKAADACRAALTVRTRDAAPLPFAATQNNLGSALFLLGRLTGESAHLEGAAKAFETARAVYTEHGADAMAAVTEKNLSHVERLLGGPAAARRHDTDGKGADRPPAHGRRPARPGKKRRRRG
ncbi:MAG: hypothetical protein ACE5FR_09935 [Rhodospirillales bacterium]